MAPIATPRPPAQQPVLHTARIRLEPLSDKHLEHEVELDADAQVMRYLDNGPRSRQCVEEKHRERLEVAQRSGNLGFWAGFLQDGGPDDGSFVGWWLLEPPDRPDQGPATGQAELGFRLLPRFWRRGLAAEGSRELLRYGFVDLGLDRVFGETMAVNEGSRATMAKVGMQHETTSYGSKFEEEIDGSELGEVVYAISQEQWLAFSLVSEGQGDVQKR